MRRHGFQIIAALFAVLVLLVGGLAACSAAGSAGSIRIMAFWNDSESASFLKVIREFEKQENITVSYEGTLALNQVLQSEVQQGTPPDIAILPSLGDIATYAREGYLKPLDDVSPQHDAEYGPQWLQLEKAGTAHRYGMVVKADLKSAVWFNPAQLPQPNPKPQNAERLNALVDQITKTGRTPWCLGMGATPNSGWPGTDWIEDIVLHRSGPEVYQQWAAGKLSWKSDEIRSAWTTWGQLLRHGAAIRGGVKSALLTDFGDAGKPMFTEPPGCMLDHKASYVIGTYDNYSGSPDFDFFETPSFGAVGASEVSADLAGMFNDTPQVRKLLAFLSSEHAQRMLAQDGRIFSVNWKVGSAAYPSEVSKRVARTLNSDLTLCFDASDLMPQTIRTAFYRAVLEYLNDPNQLDNLLDQLDKVQASVSSQEWLNVPCGRK